MEFDLSTGDDVRNVSIRSGLRGYNKDDVEELREAVATLVDELRRRADAASAHLAQVGLEEPLDLREEFVTVGKEISAILEAARTAATEIRGRATADGERWRTEAEKDAARMRTDAWEEASTQLEAAVEKARQERRSADEDALYIRAQAEKEAIRLAAEARREADDLVRGARAEAESIIAAARDSAEAAQERARALEHRRDELLRELEEARRAIGIVEADIDAQHERLVSAESRTVRILGQDQDGDEGDDPGETRWLDEDATVRLVTPGEPSRPAPMGDLEPVLDADDIVAEVELLQEAPYTPPAPGEAAESREATMPPVAEDVAPVAVSPPESALEPIVGSGDETVTAPVEVEEVERDAADEQGADDEDPEAGHGSGVADEAEAGFGASEAALEEPLAIGAERSVAAPSGDDLAGLFASLRSPDTAPAGGATAADGTRSVPSAVSETVTDEAPVVDMQEGSVEAAHPAREDTGVGDDRFADREATLLPITNRALRIVKKLILEFQGVMLEATKADPDGWRPDAEEYRLALDPHVQALADEAHRAAGGEGPSPLDVEFGQALADAVTRAATNMLGSGYRETSASLGRVYRSWRSDEAERRLVSLAADAYELAAPAGHQPGGHP